MGKTLGCEHAAKVCDRMDALCQVSNEGVREEVSYYREYCKHTRGKRKCK